MRSSGTPQVSSIRSTILVIVPGEGEKRGGCEIRGADELCAAAHQLGSL
jgi:hypothetical protein